MIGEIKFRTPKRYHFTQQTQRPAQLVPELSVGSSKQDDGAHRQTIITHTDEPPT